MNKRDLAVVGIGTAFGSLITVITQKTYKWYKNRKAKAGKVSGKKKAA